MNLLVRRIFHIVLDSANPRSLARWFRARRLRLILDVFRPGPDTLVLDVGSAGSFFPENWPYPGRVLSLDILYRPEMAAHSRLVVVADLRALPFRNRSIDIICNSVLEHLGPVDEQRKAAAEIQRAARRFFVQIPYLYFPIDPHYFTVPYFQLLPERYRRWICKRISVGYIPRGDFLPVHYLNASRFAALFPGARLAKEKLFFLTKSLYVLKE